MTDEQRSLAGYKSKVHEGSEFENPNEGKPILNDSDEYIFRLKEFPKVKTFSQIKEKKDGTRQTIKVDKAICEFEEETTKNVVTAFFRVDSLNFSEDEAFESAIVRFFKKIKKPLAENIEPNWEDHFLVGMRFRGRVVIGKDEKKIPNGNYYLDIPTCRPILQNDMHPEAAATLTNQDAPQKVAKAISFAKGATTAGDAFALMVGKVPQDFIQEFIAADKRGEIKYPL